LTVVRLRGFDRQLYELLNVTGNAEAVLRDEHNEVTVHEVVEIEAQCERCGRFGRDVSPASPNGPWACYGTANANACSEAAEKEGSGPNR
jgi:hypothetical protein